MVNITLSHPSPKLSMKLCWIKPFAGYPNGYPVLFDTALSMGRAMQLLTYLGDGDYLNKKSTKSLVAQVRITRVSVRYNIILWSLSITYCHMIQASLLLPALMNGYKYSITLHFALQHFKAVNMRTRQHIQDTMHSGMIF